MSTAEKRSFDTIAVKTNTGIPSSPRPLSLPIYHAVNFEFPTSPGLGKDFNEGSPWVYQRFGHPNARAAAEKIAALEGAEAALVFSSGMGAISTTILTLAGKSGSHILAQREIFAQTYSLLEEVMRPLGVHTDYCAMDSESEVQKLLKANTSFIYLESPSNPLIKLVDIESIAGVARKAGIPVLIDSTFASPCLQTPLKHGADLVLHSATKFLGGHSDVMCGAVAGSNAFISRIEQTQMLVGNVLDPNAAWLLLRGIKTLPLRVRRQADSALAIANRLSSHPAVARINYPFLKTSPYFAIAQKQMLGGGGVLSFELKGGKPYADRFVAALRLISIATSLGGVETVIEIPKDLDFSEEELGTSAKRTGIGDGLIRLSVGTEDLSDLLADIDRGLAAI